MMLMPVGPPALKLTALADVTGSDDKEKMSIAKFLTVRSGPCLVGECFMLITETVFIHHLADSDVSSCCGHYGYAKCCWFVVLQAASWYIGV